MKKIKKTMRVTVASQSGKIKVFSKYFAIVFLSALTTLIVIEISLSVIKTSELNRQRTLLNNFSDFIVDPLYLMKKIDNKDKGYMVIDVRGKENYDQGHIIGAINLPLYERGVVSLNEKAKITNVNNFINKINIGSKLVIVYGHVGFDTNARELTTMFLAKGKTAKILTIGWSEWKSLITQLASQAQLKNNDITQYIEPLIFPAFGPPGGPL